MTEMPQQPAEDESTSAPEPEPQYEWKGADTTSGAPGGDGGTDARSSGREWLGQLQSMIDDLATQAAPVVRQIGSKAAELAALAGEKAGPLAHRAADATETVGIKIAERSRQLAEDLKREPAGEPPAGAEPPVGTTPSTEDEDGA